jgi:hypothetical protein
MNTAIWPLRFGAADAAGSDFPAAAFAVSLKRV